MDINATLEEMLSLATSLQDAADCEELIDSDDAVRLAELVEALNGWISKGGFLPTAWARK